MTDTGGLFYAHYFRQSIPKRQSALIAQLRPVSAMTDKDRRGINNFKTNTRARAIQRIFRVHKKGKEDQDARTDKTLCARQNHLLPLLPQNLTFITI
nr:MAG TPA: hypothetical protein [Caudoviricetes sp.]DAX83945.1 MAG TPA: hypothetical protein [Caudoviricetes sp.]